MHSNKPITHQTKRKRRSKKAVTDIWNKFDKEINFSGVDLECL